MGWCAIVQGEANRPFTPPVMPFGSGGSEQIQGMSVHVVFQAADRALARSVQAVNKAPVFSRKQGLC